ncbi:MAG: FAD synthetase family protein [Spirochaetaceae bacterium]|nr:FAD synthetase family protein [Spirochaetaceae bacterium]
MRVADWTELTGNNRSFNPDNPDNPEKSAMTVGVFDGVHKGHQALIEKIVRYGAYPTVITFRRSPKQVLHPGTAGAVILSLPQKLRIFESLGVSRTILIDFSEHFSKLKGRDFIEILIRQGAMGYLAVGSNFRCGRGLDTDAALIKDRYETADIRIDVVPPVMDRGGPISSSRIREAIREGKLAAAAEALGRNIALDLRGIEARQEGSETVFCPQGRALPPDGRYPVSVYEENEENKENDKNKKNDEGKTAEIQIQHGAVRIPSCFNAVTGIEFISGFQGE